MYKQLLNSLRLRVTLLTALFCVLFAQGVWGTDISLSTNAVEITDFSSVGSSYITTTGGASKDIGGYTWNVYQCMNLGKYSGVTYNNLQMKSGSGIITSPTISSPHGFTVTVTYSSTKALTLQIGNENAQTGSTTSKNEQAGTGATVTATTTSTSTSFRISADNAVAYVSSIKITPTQTSTPTCAAPTFSPAAGTYTSAQNVTLSTTTEGATIYYTTDGNDPTTSSKVYSSAILVSETTTIKAIATKPDYDNSSVASATYTIQQPITIAAVRTQGTGSVLTQGIITYINGRNAYIQDTTGAICVYASSNNYWTNNSYAVGDEITVSGTLFTYNSMLEITSPTVSKVSSSNTLPCVVKTISEINTDGYTDLQCMYVQIVQATYDATNNKVSQGANEINVYGTMGDATDGDVVTFKGNVAYYSNALQISNLSDVTISHDPTITTAASLAAPNYVVGTADPEYETLTVNGSYLTSDITLTLNENSNFEMSTDLDTWTNTLTLSQSSGNVTNAEVAVRMKAGLAKGSYSGFVTLSSTGTTNVAVSLSGTVTGQTYAINVDDQVTGGTIEADLETAEEGATVTLTATPDAAYNFTSWTVYEDDLETEITVTNNQFTMPACEVYVSATFTAKPTYAITCNYDDQQGLLDASPASAYEGQTVTLSFTEETGYTLSSIVLTKTSDGSATGITLVASGDDFTFTMPGYAVTATATFEEFVDYVTLPFEWAGGGSASLLAITGVSASSLSSDYASSHDPYNVKFDNTGKYIQVKTDGQPGKVTVGVKMIGGASTSKITVQESSNGTDFSDVQELSISGNQNAILSLETSNAFASSTRYIRLYFTKGSNVGVGPITIAKASSDPVINAESSIELTAEATSGEIAYTIGNPVGGTSLTAAEKIDVDWISDVAVDAENSKVTFTTTANTGSTSRSATITLTYGDLTKDITVNQAKPTVTYTLVSSITPGKTYIIASGTSGTIQTMGAQKSNNRGVVDVTATSNTISITGDDPAEFVVYGPDANGYYSIYDGTGYLYAAGSGSNSNYLRTQETNDMNGKWSISIDNESGEATVVAQGDKTNNNMRFNSTLFSCYGSTSSVKDLVYFYEKADAALATTVSKTLNAKGYSTFATTDALDFLDSDNAEFSAWQIRSINGETIEFSHIVSHVAAGTGVLLKGTANAAINLNILPVGGYDLDEDNKLVGIISATDVTTDEYYGLSGDTFVPVNAGTVPAGKALLPTSVLTSGESEVRAFTFVFVDPTTGITETQNVSAEDFGAIFNLAGQRMSQPQKGVNIINGKKVLVK